MIPGRRDARIIQQKGEEGYFWRMPTLTGSDFDQAVLIERTAEACVMVIFGASGDLTKRKLVPALFDLDLAGALPPAFSVVGVGRTPMSDDGFRSYLQEALRGFGRLQDAEVGLWDQFARRLSYISSDPSSLDGIRTVAETLDRIDAVRITAGNLLFYLATPPSLYEPIIKNLGAAGLNVPRKQGDWVRVIIEKPFGRDLDSARRLNNTLLAVLTEDQIYRIDHYLGKETVQNLLVFRFANGVFEPIWNRNFIDNIQITAAETVGVENRAAYYEEAGAMRDMVQNHLLQVMALIAMEPPVMFDARQVRDEKQKVYQAIRPITSSDVPHAAIRGQYVSGMINSVAVPGYREEKGVAPDSRTETFVAVRLMVDNWRWADVPFYIRTGKRLPERLTEIVVHFKRTPHLLFADLDPGYAHNSLVIRIQPDEGISLRFVTKSPGSSFRVQPVIMDFSYGTSFDGHLVEAYTRLLLDCMLGDQTLYARGDSVDTAWTLIDPVREAWNAPSLTPVFQYSAGSWGPAEADSLPGRDGRQWHLC